MQNPIRPRLHQQGEEARLYRQETQIREMLRHAVTPPIILDYRGDIVVVDSLEEALIWAEPDDVKDHEFDAFDGEGNKLHFGITQTRVLFGLLAGPHRTVF